MFKEMLLYFGGGMFWGILVCLLALVVSMFLPENQEHIYINTKEKTERPEDPKGQN